MYRVIEQSIRFSFRKFWSPYYVHYVTTKIYWIWRTVFDFEDFHF